ncbi:uncharacterized protein SPAPADRAFT_131849 [Spathaspora passalidarum NRRL Y-27907]|uniref:Globin domain-containing protein n=1 Tax=Spathaspora passalidarum (strain NRRL Y-27907 / 11-Y1) TaxID=619300 RepID=G3AFI9_SPAPN|nr:uncharacterized protein SPAPADRAFT_131849 [Spathaspora passalidarum NRRL Y-27907]EGW34978.1 hypothetical protein SPAPADRAFT_131849 [Spathaspora passalidarum NRRL Y-27907]
MELNQIKVSLSLSKSEIDIIRYSWQDMLIENETTFPRPTIRSTNPSIPGGYPEEYPNEPDNQTIAASVSDRVKAKSLARATTLFCQQLYKNLLDRDHALERMFPSIKHQATHFATVLTVAVMQLDDLSTLDDYLCRLGKRHARVLGVEPAQFELMGEALVETFHQRFGARFNQELEIVWIKLYLYLANTILQFGIDPVMKLEQEQLPAYDNRVYNQETNMGSEPDCPMEVWDVEAPPLLTPKIISVPSPTIYDDFDQTSMGRGYHSACPSYGNQ